ncbi:GNAT family N-acetyltransferase [Microbacterium sp. NPDC056569]|uniref:GNAT family N-acetyltransferase n=1 Tax=Microbacterium sp. NPDC056569 TaxID=3345867 RepID=UPI00366B57D4
MDNAMPSPGEAVLETERLQLRRWLVSDAAVQRRLWAERDARVPPHRRISVDGHPTVQDLEDRIRQENPQASLGLLAAVRKQDGAVTGYCGLIANSYGEGGEPELAYELLRNEWGQGLATEAAGAVVDWARSLGYRRLWATVRDWNSASQRVLAKLGFVQTSRVEPDPEHGDSLFFMKDLEPAR